MNTVILSVCALYSFPWALSYAVRLIVDTGFNLVNFTSNHSYDAGTEGIEFSQEELDGILTAAREKIAKAKEYAVSCEYPDPSEFLTDVYAE